MYTRMDPSLAHVYTTLTAPAGATVLFLVPSTNHLYHNTLMLIPNLPKNHTHSDLVCMNTKCCNWVHLRLISTKAIFPLHCQAQLSGYIYPGHWPTLAIHEKILWSPANKSSETDKYWSARHIPLSNCSQQVSSNCKWSHNILVTFHWV